MRTEDTERDMKEERKEEVLKEEEIVKEAWGSMTLGKKTEYLWMYYRGWLFGAMLLITVVCLGVMTYKGKQMPVLLNAVIVGGNDLKADWLEESFAGYAGIEEEDGILRFRTNIPDDGGGMTSTTALTTLMGAEAVDVLVCPENVYEEYGSQGGFLDMRELLGDRAKEYEDMLTDHGICLRSGNLAQKEELTAYDEDYEAIPVNSQNPEMAVRFVEYLLQ